jgi:CRISPR-associated protein Cas2
VSAEPDNPPEEEDLLPDERPCRSKYAESDLAGKTWEKSSLKHNNPFQLQPSTAADPPLRRRSRGKQGRDQVCSKYRMAWVLVFFDLPVGTPEERKAATNFRKDLIHDGYFMVQFSVYARPCGTADRVKTQVRRLKSKIPAHGEVRGLMISDAQWGRMIIIRSQQKADAEKMPTQMQFF